MNSWNKDLKCFGALSFYYYIINFYIVIQFNPQNSILQNIFLKEISSNFEVSILSYWILNTFKNINIYLVNNIQKKIEWSKIISFFNKRMIKKVIAFNGSQRKGYNTNKLVQKCLEWAKSLGADVKYYQVSDMKNIKPCISCLSCKRKDKKYFGKCVLKDGLTSILNEIKTTDAIVIGTPVYYDDITASIHLNSWENVFLKFNLQ